MILPICRVGALESELNSVAKAARLAGSNRQEALLVVPLTPGIAETTWPF